MVDVKYRKGKAAGYVALGGSLLNAKVIGYDRSLTKLRNRMANKNKKDFWIAKLEGDYTQVK